MKQILQRALGLVMVILLTMSIAVPLPVGADDTEQSTLDYMEGVHYENRSCNNYHICDFFVCIINKLYS